MIVSGPGKPVAVRGWRGVRTAEDGAITSWATEFYGFVVRADASEVVVRLIQGPLRSVPNDPAYIRVVPEWEIPASGWLPPATDWKRLEETLYGKTTD